MSIATPPAAGSGASPVVPWRFRWTCDQFHQLGDLGLFEGRNLILVNGEILEMPPPNPPHETATGLADYLFKQVFASGFWVRVQMALMLGQDIDPVPDVAVVPGSPRNYPTHPTSALLVVEVSDSSLAYDTADKASLYAAAGIADYWVVDLVHRRLVVFRDPKPDASQPFGAGYARHTYLGPADTVAPLAAPQNPITVADLPP